MDRLTEQQRKRGPRDEGRARIPALALAFTYAPPRLAGLQE